MRGAAEHLEPGGVAQLLGNWEYATGRTASSASRLGRLRSTTGSSNGRCSAAPSTPRRGSATAARAPAPPSSIGCTTRGSTTSSAAACARSDSATCCCAGRRCGSTAQDGATRAGTRPPAGRRRRWRASNACTDRSAPTSGGLGVHLAECLAAHDRQAAIDDEGLAALRLTVAGDVTEERHYWPGDDDPTAMLLRQGGGFGRTIALDTGLAALVGASDGELSVGAIVAALGELLDVDAAGARRRPPAGRARTHRRRDAAAARRVRRAARHAAQAVPAGGGTRMTGDASPQRRVTAFTEPAGVFCWSHTESEPMADSPLSDSPYEVLGVPADADAAELRLAYRRALRTAHPDTGGDPVRFHAVQRAWSLVGTPEARAAFDRGVRGPVSAPTREAWAPAAPSRPRDSRPLARSYGHPGGLTRELYLARMREWVGRGVEVPDPYDPDARAARAARHPAHPRRRPRRGGDRPRAVDARHRATRSGTTSRRMPRARACRPSSTTSCSARPACSRSSPRTGAARCACAAASSWARRSPASGRSGPSRHVRRRSGAPPG